MARLWNMDIHPSIKPHWGHTIHADRLDSQAKSRHSVDARADRPVKHGSNPECKFVAANPCCPSSIRYSAESLMRKWRLPRVPEVRRNESDTGLDLTNMICKFLLHIWISLSWGRLPSRSGSAISHMAPRVVPLRGLGSQQH